MTASATALYARISSDDGSALGVQRQLEDCRDLAEKHGWINVVEYVDNDISAFSGRARPKYMEMLDEIRSGTITALVVWDIDRLTRTPAELEEFILLADLHKLNLASVGGEVDLATPQGRLTARIKGSVARHEVEQQSRRLRRKFLERAKAGKTHGKVPYGWLREPVLDESGVVTGSVELIAPPAAAVIETSAKRILAGEPLRAVVRDLNAGGSEAPNGKPWSGTTLRQVLLRERNAGRRIHQGQVIGRGEWPAILDEDTFDRLVAALRDPQRRSNSGSEVRWLLSGVARCGLCGGRMRSIKGGVRGNRVAPRAYVCSQCTRVRRKQEAVDAVVEGVVLGRLARPDAAGLFGGDPLALEEATNKKLAAEARLNTAADQFADGVITGQQLARITSRLREDLDAAEAAIRAAQPSADLAQFATPDVERVWRGATLERRRAVIETMVTVTIEPAGSGGGFDPSKIRIEWKA